jgi:hypothetical protein
LLILNKGGLVEVVAVVLADFAEGLDADGKFLAYHDIWAGLDESCPGSARRGTWLANERESVHD